MWPRTAGPQPTEGALEPCLAYSTLINPFYSTEMSPAWEILVILNFKKKTCAVFKALRCLFMICAVMVQMTAGKK